MKKIVLLSAMLLALVGCEQKQTPPPAPAAPAAAPAPAAPDAGAQPGSGAAAPNSDADKGDKK